MAAQAKKETHKWTPEETRRIIRFRAENEQRFLKSKYRAKQLWETLVKEMGLEGKLNGQQASKKWENLKRKYKDLKTPKTGSGTDAGEATAATWQYYEDMHEVLGGRPSVDPPVVVASFNDEDPVTILMEIVEPSTASNTIGASSPLPNTGATASPSAASPMATPSTLTPSPRKRKRQTNPILEFLIEESREEQKRHKESEATTERFLCLFEKLIDKT